MSLFRVRVRYEGMPENIWQVYEFEAINQQELIAYLDVLYPNEKGYEYQIIA